MSRITARWLFGDMHVTQVDVPPPAPARGGVIELRVPFPARIPPEDEVGVTHPPPVIALALQFERDAVVMDAGETLVLRIGEAP